MIKEYKYTLGQIEKGYNNRTLYVNLSDNTIKEKPVTQMMKDKFVGGKGFGLKLLWDATKPDTKWNDPENEIVISGGPVCGITQYSGAGKSLVVAISPLTDVVIDSNVGGFFGPFMKFSGFDSLEIQGKADKDVMIFIDGVNGKVSIEDFPLKDVDSHLIAEHLTEMYANDKKDKMNVAVVSSGSAAEHTLIGHLNFSFYDMKKDKVRLKQAGRGGLGTVLSDKKIRAIVAKIPGVKGNLNNVANLEAIMER